MAAKLSLRTVTIGPKNRRVGRSYGLRTLLPNVGMQSREAIQGFAEALSSWSQTAQAKTTPNFCLLMELTQDEGYLLLRAANLGPGSDGTVAVAQGFFLTSADMREIENRAHLLLSDIPEPTLAPWEQEWQDVNVAERFPKADAKVKGIENVLRRNDGLVRIGMSRSGSSDAELVETLESLRLDQLASARPWTQYEQLRRGREFNPFQFSICFGDVDAESDDYFLLTVQGGRANLSGARDAWGVLFYPLDSELTLATTAVGTATIENKELRAALAQAKWHPSYTGSPAENVIANTIAEIAQNAQNESDIFDLLEVLAKRISGIPAEDGDREREIASRGLTIFFEGTEADKRSLGQFLGLWAKRVAPYLTGPANQPLQYAVDRGVMAHVAETTFGTFLRKEPDEEVLSLFDKWLSTPSSRSEHAETLLLPKLASNLGQLAQQGSEHATSQLETVASHFADITTPTAEQEKGIIHALGAVFSAASRSENIGRILAKGGGYGAALAKSGGPAGFEREVAQIVAKTRDAIKQEDIKSLFCDDLNLDQANRMAILPILWENLENSIG